MTERRARRLRASVAGLCAALAACGVGPPGPDDGPGEPSPASDGGVDSDPPAVVSCEAPPAGTLPESLVEARPGIEQALASLNVHALPAHLPPPPNEVAAALAHYLVDAPRTDAGFDRDALLDAGVLGHVVLGAYAVKSPLADAGVDIAFLRRGLHRYYACATQQPRTLADLEATIGHYLDWPRYDVASKPKGGTRRLRRQGAVHVAETLLPDGGVRETEVMLEGRRADGALLFWSYDARGDATHVSEFATGAGDTKPGSSPYTCLSCHFHGSPMRYDLLIPD